jgi:PE family
MPKPLEVTPEHLCTASAGLTAAQAAASTGITAASATIVPAPAGVDDVSVFAAGAFGRYAGEIGAAIGGGLGKYLAGAQHLVPVAANYQAADITSSAEIQAQGSTFA